MAQWNLSMASPSAKKSYIQDTHTQTEDWAKDAKVDSVSCVCMLCVSFLLTNNKTEHKQTNGPFVLATGEV